jgi:hypothetical protein
MNKLRHSTLTCPYDTALPQPWVNAMTAAGFDPRGLVVWGYPPRSLLGVPVPLTPITAHKLLERTTCTGYLAEYLLAAWADCGVPVQEYFPLLQPVDNRNQNA